jgi:hypothetical protein
MSFSFIAPSFISTAVVVLAFQCNFAAQSLARSQTPEVSPAALRAGASAVDVSPTTFPVLVNGGFLQATATKVNDPLFARCLVLDDGTTKLAIVVVDSCMMPRSLLDRAKELARQRTGILIEHMLISATHTHSAPAAMGALGCPADPRYAANLPEQIAESIARAAGNLIPARVGWGAIDDPRHTFCRRWIRRPDRLLEDPFGQRTVRANMHPGHVSPDVIGPSGPVDPALTVLSVQTADGRPIAMLANYSQHYFGAPPISADYYGRFARALTRKLNAEEGSPPFVGIMSQGTSGDQMWMDYSQPRVDPGIDRYADQVADSAFQAYKAILHYQDRPTLAMVETTLTLRRRVPDRERLEWARAIAEKIGDRPPRTLPEVYAKEAIALHDEPQRELKLQVIRIGELGITAIPNEVFALTGLKLKARSPLPMTMNIELANGSEGYIPPPEQHALGGYTTWPARTAALEVEAEPRIVETVLGLLERASGQRRHASRPISSIYAQNVMASRPLAYWRLDEMEGSTALDATGHEHGLRVEPGIAFFLPGPDRQGLSADRQGSRSVHLAGGRLRSAPILPQESCTVELWFWNGLPNDARPVTGYLLARSSARGAFETLGLGGTGTAAGRLFLSRRSSSSPFTGKTLIQPRTWHHLALVRSGTRATVYLDGNTTPEIVANLMAEVEISPCAVTIGGRDDTEATFEGKIAEVACFDRALTAAEIAEHFQSAGARAASPDR